MKNTLRDQKFKIFWDIDGTLLNTNGAAAIPFALAAIRLSSYLNAKSLSPIDLSSSFKGFPSGFGLSL